MGTRGDVWRARRGVCRRTRFRRPSITAIIRSETSGGAAARRIFASGIRGYDHSATDGYFIATSPAWPSPRRRVSRDEKRTAALILVISSRDTIRVSLVPEKKGLGRFRTVFGTNENIGNRYCNDIIFKRPNLNIMAF